jgi:hypothetical protein
VPGAPGVSSLADASAALRGRSGCPGLGRSCARPGRTRPVQVTRRSTSYQVAPNGANAGNRFVRTARRVPRRIGDGAVVTRRRRPVRDRAAGRAGRAGDKPRCPSSTAASIQHAHRPPRRAAYAVVAPGNRRAAVPTMNGQDPDRSGISRRRSRRPNPQPARLAAGVDDHHGKRGRARDRSWPGQSGHSVIENAATPAAPISTATRSAGRPCRCPRGGTIGTGVRGTARGPSPPGGTSEGTDTDEGFPRRDRGRPDRYYADVHTRGLRPRARGQLSAPPMGGGDGCSPVGFVRRQGCNRPHVSARRSFRGPVEGLGARGRLHSC